MNDSIEKLNPYLLQLALSLQAGALQGMGKIVSPLTGKIDKNMQSAQYSIDMLAMIETKMAGNLTEKEKKLISHSLFELRMNFVEESKKQGDSQEPGESSSAIPSEKSDN